MDKDSTWTSTQHLSVSKKKRKKKLRKRIWVTNTYHMYSWVPPPISVVLMSPQQMRQAFAVRSWFHLAFLAVGSRGYWNVNRGLWQSTASKALQFSWRVVSRSVVRERFWILQRIERGHLQKESVHLGKTREREWKNILHKVVHWWHNNLAPASSVWMKSARIFSHWDSGSGRFSSWWVGLMPGVEMVLFFLFKQAATRSPVGWNSIKEIHLE